MGSLAMLSLRRRRLLRSWLQYLLAMLLLQTALLSMGADASKDTPEWDWGKPSQVAFWVLVFVAAPFAVASLAIFVFALLDLTGLMVAPACCAGNTYFWVNIVFLSLWPLPLALSIYLVMKELRVAAVFLGWAVLAMLFHSLLIVLYVKKSRSNAQDHPRQQLLIAQKYSDKNAVPDRAPHGDVAASGAAAAASAALAAQPSNPFLATYGLLPGTSQYGYQIFIPAEPPERSGLAAQNTGPTATKEPAHQHRHTRPYALDQTRTRTIRV